MDAQPRKPYSSDLTDEQWDIVKGFLPPPVPAGAPRTTNFRDVLNAIFYLLANGCAWHALPHDFPREGTVRDYFHRWRRSGLWQTIHDALRRQVREQAGKEPEPSAGRIDSQTVKASRTAGTRGYDAGKKSTASSDTCWWTRWGWCWRWSSIRRRSRTGTGQSRCSPGPSSRGLGPGCNMSGRTAATRAS